MAKLVFLSEPPITRATTNKLVQNPILQPRMCYQFVFSPCILRTSARVGRAILGKCDSDAIHKHAHARGTLLPLRVPRVGCLHQYKLGCLRSRYEIAEGNEVQNEDPCRFTKQEEAGEAASNIFATPPSKEQKSESRGAAALNSRDRKSVV